jgi:hypothetical protein
MHLANDPAALRQVLAYQRRRLAEAPTGADATARIAAISEIEDALALAERATAPLPAFLRTAPHRASATAK